MLRVTVEITNTSSIACTSKGTGLKKAISSILGGIIKRGLSGRKVDLTLHANTRCQQLVSWHFSLDTQQSKNATSKL